MKKLFAIIRKDSLVRFASRSELLFFIVLPLLFTFLLAGGTPSGNDDTRIRLVVIDEARNSLSADILKSLENSTAVRPEVLTRARAEDQFDQRRAPAVLILPARLTVDALEQGTAEVELLEQPNNLDASIARRAVLTTLRQVSSAVGAAQLATTQAEAVKAFASSAERQAYFEQSLAMAQNIQAQAPEHVVIVRGSTPDRVEYDPRANASAGQLITWVFIPLFGISALFAFERQTGTLRRFMVTPTQKSTYLLGTISGQVGWALIQMLLLVAFGTLVMKLDWGEDPAALLLMLLASALAAAAFGSLLGTLVRSEGQASGLSMTFGMLFALLGGCWYPLELFPPFMQQIAKALPTYWAMQGLLELVLRGGGMQKILPYAGVLLALAAVYFALGVLRFKYE
jgi:linearmycin/streptolysin S transport system permease protein